MKRSILRCILILSGIILISCTGKERKSPAAEEPSDQIAISTDQSGVIKVAEHIVYDVEIINPHPDDQWMNECLEGLEREVLINFVFEGIYSGQFSAYDIFEGTPISARKIKKMEENNEFSRDRIGKFQFVEEWILDTIHLRYFKEVTEIRMGLQTFNQEGEVTSYAPLFRVVL